MHVYVDSLVSCWRTAVVCFETACNASVRIRTQIVLLGPARCAVCANFVPTNQLSASVIWSPVINSNHAGKLLATCEFVKEIKRAHRVGMQDPSL